MKSDVLEALTEPTIVDGAVIEENDDWKSTIYNEVKATTGVDPAVELYFPRPIKEAIADLMGASPTNFTRDMVDQVNEALASDEAAKLWWQMRQKLETPEQIALPPGPTASEEEVLVGEIEEPEPAPATPRRRKR